MEQDLKELQKENNKIYVEIEKIIIQSKINNQLRREIYKQITLLIDNEIEQEKFCNQ